MSGLRIAGFRLLCRDPAAIAAFFGAAFDARSAEGPGFAVSLGAQRVELAEAATSGSAPAPSNATGFQHLALVVRDMDAAMARLGAVPGWSPISRARPERLPASSGGVQAFKFRDPEGHPLELLAFPPDAVPPAWQGPPGLVLGIDHTAITVADTERSVAFYGALGFTVTSRGLNHGPEQARMDAVAAPRVEVTGLAPPGGAPPHLELLRYRDPGTVMSRIPDDDVLATRILLQDADARWPEGLRRDPDGHRLELEDPLRPRS